MNAFHPDYIKTYHPEFGNFFKSQQALTAEREMVKKSVKPKRFYVYALADRIKPSKRNYAML
jgi:hypothetical protein